MTAIWKFVTLAGAALALAHNAPGAQAQTATVDQHATLQASASVTSSDRQSTEASPTSNRWLCASRSSIEIQPVSSDVSGQAPAWVVVYRRDGHAVASERIDASSVADIQKNACDPSAPARQTQLVG